MKFLTNCWYRLERFCTHKWKNKQTRNLDMKKVGFVRGNAFSHSWGFYYRGFGLGNICYDHVKA